MRRHVDNYIGHFGGAGLIQDTQRLPGLSATTVEVLVVILIVVALE